MGASAVFEQRSNVTVTISPVHAKYVIPEYNVAATVCENYTVL